MTKGAAVTHRTICPSTGVSTVGFRYGLTKATLLCINVWSGTPFTGLERQANDDLIITIANSAGTAKTIVVVIADPEMMSKLERWIDARCDELS